MKVTTKHFNGFLWAKARKPLHFLVCSKQRFVIDRVEVEREGGSWAAGGARSTPCPIWVVGASLSGLAAGVIVDHYGYTVAFLSLGAGPALALIVFAVGMPETANHDQ